MASASDPAFGAQTPFDRDRVESFLREHGTDRMPHPGGTLFEHVCRVADLVAAWGGDQPTQAASLCHACYSTDGYPPALLATSERGRLADLIGARAESLVYRYASCDRRFAYPQFGGAARVEFRDRFTGATATPGAADLRAFAELTAANEVDVMAHNPELAAEHGGELLDLLRRMRGLLSDGAWRACADLLGQDQPP